MKRLVLLSAVIALAIAGCGDGDELTPDQRAAQDYVRAVEVITGDIYTDGQRALATLNRLADGKLEAPTGARLLEEIAAEMGARAEKLDTLTPPEPAESSSGELASGAEDLAFELETAASGIRAADRGVIDLADTARSGARVVLAKQSAVSSLSRAVRALAIESVDFPPDF